MISRGRSIIVALVLVMCAGAAVGQETSYPIQNFALLDVEAELVLEGKYRTDDETRRGVPSKEDDLFFREAIELSGDGYVYHPNLIEWTASFLFGLSQEQSTIVGENRSSDGVLLGYNINTHFLREKQYSARVYANRSNNVIDRNFARAIEQERQTEGFELFRRGDIPMTLGYEHFTLIEENESRLDDEETHLFTYRVEDMRDRHWYTELYYEYENTSETNRQRTGDTFATSEFPLERHEVNIRNDWKFGPEDLPHRLTGNIRALQRTGTFENTAFHISQLLDLRHTETLSSFYRGRFSISDTFDQDETTYEVEVGVRKKIYESLDIIARLYGEVEQFDDGDQTRYGGELDLDYRKNTPIGRYTSRLTVSREWETEASDAGLRRRIGESVTLSGTTFVPLDRTLVVTGSVVVFNLDRTTIYIEGVDYSLMTIGDTTEIARLDGGDIADPQTVLVDYTATVARDSEFTTDEWRWRHRIDFDRWPVAVYFEYRRRAETLTGGTDPGNLDIDQTWLFGGELELYDFFFSGEYEMRDQELSPPTRTIRARATYARRLYKSTSVSAGVHYLHTDYLQPERFGLEVGEEFLETRGAFANVSTKMGRHTLLRFNVEYNDTTGRQVDSRLRAGATMEWSYGKTDVVVEGYHSIYEQNETEGVTDFVRFSLRRTF
jgi:hypothetical protein